MKMGDKHSILMVITLALTTAAMGIPTRVSSPSPSATDNAAPGGISEELHDMLHGAQAARQRDPLGAMSGEMSGIVNELDEQQTGEPVQADQRQVVSQLDKLIEELNKQCNGKAGTSNNPTKPMADSKIAKGPGGSGPMHDPQVGVKSWGQLPARERDKILQSQNDGFPAGYESLLSSYYSRLAQEQVGDEQKAGGAGPATQP